MKEYDLILVVGYFRSATAFLAVIRALGGLLRIAVLPVQADPAMHQKTGNAHTTYLELCRGFGAAILAPDECARAKLMVVQQFPYADELAKNIRLNITAADCVGLMTLAMAGIEKHDAFLAQFEIRQVYVPSRRFMEFLLEKRMAEGRYEGVEIKEVGLPFARYRVFPDFNVDWIVAAPTLFSFHSESGKQQFLQSVIRLLGQIDPDDVVVYKPHNGNFMDYFAPRIHYRIASWIERLPGGWRLVEVASAFPWCWLRNNFEKVQTCILHRKVLRRAVPMSEMTQYAEMSLEAFLPGVRKGVIGGLSNTIWGALYFDLPFYNCVDPQLRQGGSSLYDKNPDVLLNLNLEYFGVPFCDGVLGVDTRTLGIVRSDERGGDLVTEMLHDLARASDYSRE